MKANVSRLLERASKLGIAEERSFNCRSLYEPFRDTSLPSCQYWTQKHLEEFSKSHPQSAESRRAGGFHVLNVGCPRIPESDWLTLGNGKMDDDGYQLPSVERPCAGCEHYKIHDHE